MRTPGSGGRILVIGSTALTLVLLGPPAPAAEPAGARDPSAEFGQICRTVRDSYDPFYGELRSRETRQRLEAGVDEPAERAVLEALLGREYLKLGRTDEAIALLERALTEVDLNPGLRLDTEVHLGLAHLQAAEDQNCILTHTADSCLLPIRGQGVHRRPAHTRKAWPALVGSPARSEPSRPTSTTPPTCASPTWPRTVFRRHVSASSISGR